MQKTISFICLINLVFTQVNSQNSFFGINAGYHYVKINTSSNVSMNPTFGESIGVSILRVRKDNWEMNFDFSFEKYHYEGFTRLSYYLGSTENGTIDAFSGLANYSALKFIDKNKHFKLGAGIWMSANSNDHKYQLETIHYWGTSDDPSKNYDIDRLLGVDIGPSFDAIYCFNTSAQLGLKYRVGMINQNYDQTNDTWRQNFLGFNFTYYFGRDEAERSVFKKRPSENFKKE